MSFRRRHPYPQARLCLGILNIGFWVLLAVAALILRLPEQFFSSEPQTGRLLITALGLFLSGYVVLQAPFDLLGGFFLPTFYRRFYGFFSDFIGLWLRGVAVQTVVLLIISLTLVYYSQFLIWVALGWTLLLLLGQLPMARLVGSFHTRGENGWKSHDEAFTGGIAGLPGWQKAIFVTGRGPRQRAMDERRRHSLQKMFLPTSGVVMAASFNLIGILLASLLSRHPLNTVAGLVELALWFTLWSFLGLLILPSLSRPAVYAADYALYAKGFTEDEFESFLKFDVALVGEKRRSPWVERIFHPVPAAANRLAQWGQPLSWNGGWHAARYAIYLSWAGLSLLNRSVHCNIGKPNVWVMLPCD